MTRPICPFPRDGECLGSGYPTAAMACVRVAASALEFDARGRGSAASAPVQDVRSCATVSVRYDPPKALDLRLKNFLDRANASCIALREDPGRPLYRSSRSGGRGKTRVKCGSRVRRSPPRIFLN